MAKMTEKTAKKAGGREKKPASTALGRTKSLGKAMKSVRHDEEEEKDKKEETVRLRKELATLAKDMVYEDLRFLVAQSMLLLRNREAESLEREIAESYEGVSQHRGVQGPRATSGAPKPGIQIIRSSSGNANLVIDGNFKLLTPEELVAIAKISIGDGSEEELAERLYRWFDRERRDILLDYGMDGKRSPRLRELLAYCRKTFSKKKGKG
jgi:hypothetical protein